MRKIIIELNSLEITAAAARIIASDLFAGAILLLWGKMGAGKTTFAKSLCAGLGVLPEIVTSPTYTLVNIYHGKMPVYHVDLFRLTEQEQLDDFDRQDLIAEQGVTLVEWPEFIPDYLTDEPVLNLCFKTVSENQRQLILQSEFSNFDTIFKTLEQPILSLLKGAANLDKDSA
ncbi:MAG: tRNA (adenosine(37)-N6)-threonylcarbamoyltransferase complex ATPase subunit type 1 TsaE [SAR324 cluster bacterium]|nr:tRNA (adenosine(37)-N6)-threonylcarbamoyltransferase complex ATPase subunit type 1 TsaE [SAR324 cluster bacterium]MBL7035283.1 tRNA (adenosine(37)-N6)-threonylcarbamoyltransferase complex ATPase subunit type 1 TsaE [SAR324 cluster bacterium]